MVPQPQLTIVSILVYLPPEFSNRKNIPFYYSGTDDVKFIIKISNNAETNTQDDGLRNHAKYH
jgi:hypothetical protein